MLLYFFHSLPLPLAPRSTRTLGLIRPIADRRIHDVVRSIIGRVALQRDLVRLPCRGCPIEEEEEQEDEEEEEDENAKRQTPNVKRDTPPASQKRRDV